ncbi:MAG: hypothetical protein K2W80_15135 [Burkholderiales bacterium]|nr:hypothetical protein [Burkholderiales bacterium]
MQKQAFVEAYLEADRPADALAWLEHCWGRTESTRLGLRSDTLGRLGRFAESAEIRQHLFEHSLSTFNLQRWLEHLPETSHAAARERAHHLALNHNDPITAATLLLHLGDDQSAEAILMSEPPGMRGDSHGAAPLAKALQAHHRPRGATVIYRALVTTILDRANPRGYRHAADYWVRLCEIADQGVALVPLGSHEAYVATIRTRHARKTAFWARVNAARRSGAE